MFYDNLKAICDEKGVKITPIVNECGGAKGSISNWKKGASPNSDIVAKLAVRLNVSTDLLIFGKESSTTSPEFAVASEYALSENEEELLRVFKNLPKRERVKLLNVVYDFEEQYRNSGSSGSLELPMPNNPLVSQNEQRLLEVFQNFTETEQVKIIDRIQEWLETKRRRESINSQPIPSQPAEPPILNTQNKWRLTARRTDGVYESRFATPEEVEKLRELLNNPDLEEPEY